MGEEGEGSHGHPSWSLAYRSGCDGIDIILSTGPYQSGHRTRHWPCGEAYCRCTGYVVL